MVEEPDAEARPTFDWHRWLPAIVAASIVLGAIIGAVVTVLVTGANSRPGSSDLVETADALASVGTTSTTTAPTTTTTQPTTTTTEPPPTTTEPPPPPEPTMESEPHDFDDSGEWRTELPEPFCVTGTISITEITFTPGEYDDAYNVRAVLQNNTNVSWEFYSGRVDFGSATYPDRTVESADLYAEVNEIRPNERLPLRGSTYSSTPLTTAWWDPDSEWAFTGWPMVDEPWTAC